MDVKFYEFASGRDFMIEIGYFDTVQEIKEKIQKYEGIPISSQTLIFKGQVMVDEHDTVFYEVLHNSQIQLLVKREASSSSKSIVKKEESSSATTSSSSSILQLIIKIPNMKKQISIDMEATYSVNKLKEKIHVAGGLPLNRLSVIFNGNELNDNSSLEEHAIPNLSEIIAVLRPSPSSTPPPSNNGISSTNKRLKLMVLPKGGAQKVQVEVNSSDNVGELKKELQLMQQQQMNFSLPSEGYFFIYKQNVMEDDRTFRWHEVKQGETIEIFSGSITGGS
ncbi:hypothetical protein AQUCO_03200053v1 [Aquilegia coerulea]|uniref:Ubiquitin-like domain-containing protein n=1 Tax=Aquilegia coerulea TaxID=218851 RepID=A0A2G5CZW8_AQUCA|nr:hypothetical protein AQUCO_03200053v1 [Aquilegia coerulea]